MRFDDQVVVVTGGALGIGEAASQIFADRGAAVSILDRDAKAGARACEQIVAAGGRAIFAEVDVSSHSQVDSAIERTVEEFGGIDALAVSAGSKVWHGGRHD